MSRLGSMPDDKQTCHRGTHFLNYVGSFIGMCVGAGAKILEGHFFRNLTISTARGLTLSHAYGAQFVYLVLACGTAIIPVFAIGLASCKMRCFSCTVATVAGSNVHHTNH